MGQMIKLTTKDGVTIGAYESAPTGNSRGGLVVLQEIFGVNHHIRDVADDFAAAGYHAIAPALFDRVAPGTELGYDSEDIQKGVAIRARTKLEDTLADIEAAVGAAAQAGRVGVVGYCWGGSSPMLPPRTCRGLPPPSAIMAAGLPACWPVSFSVRSFCISAIATKAFRWLMSKRSGARIRTSRSTSIRPSTGSIALSARAIIRPPPNSHASARSISSPNVSDRLAVHERRRAPASVLLHGTGAQGRR